MADTVERPTSELPCGLAHIRSYDQLHAALRKRADDLRVTRLSMDDVGGMPPGYFGKVLGPEQVKLAGKHSLGALLGVLGCMLILVEDTEALARFTARVEKRRMNTNDRILTKRALYLAGISGDSEWGKSMRKMAMIRIGARRRKQIARTAIKARWAKHHARAVKDKPL